MKNRNLQFVEVKFGLGASKHGAQLGVDAIKIAAVNAQSNLFYKYPSTSVPINEDWIKDNNENKFANHINVIIEAYQRVSETVCNTLQADNFAFVLAGDHSTAAGTIAGIKKAFPDKKLGVIWVDAHGDLHSPYTSPSGNLHGMPLGVALNFSKTEIAKMVADPINKVPASIVKQWNELCQIGKQGSNLEPENLVFIGIRDLEDAEWEIIEYKNIKYFTGNEKIMQQIAEDALNYLNSCDIIYVSFDIDSIDASIVPGTGTPVANGLTLKQAEILLETFWESKKLVCMEMVEINPLLDDKNKTAETAFYLLQKTIK